MKKTFILLLLLVSMQLFAQTGPIITVTTELPGNPYPALTNWSRDGTMPVITASTKPVNGRIDARVAGSKILVTIKNGDKIVCGSYTANSAPSASFNEANKVWTGNNAVALLGTSCVLPAGNYQFCVQFFGNDAKGVFPLSEEVRKSFTISGKDQPVNRPADSKPGTGDPNSRNDVGTGVVINETPGKPTIITTKPANGNPVIQAETRPVTTVKDRPGEPANTIIKEAVTCDCGKWGPLVVNNREKYYPDSKIAANCNRPFQFTANYQCNSSDQSCQAGTTWQVTKDGAMIKNNTGNSNIKETFTPKGNGIYTITLNAVCNNKPCTPVTYTIVVSDCGEGVVSSEGGGPVVNNAGNAVKCDCGAWGNLTVNNREQYKSGSKINANCNRPFQFTTSYQCSSSDRSCQAGTTWQITRDGVMIKNNTGNNNIRETFTPEGNGTYILTLNAVCNNKPCEPVTYTIVVSDCSGGGGVNTGGGGVTCDCGAWGNLVVNNRDPYKSGSKITANCNRPFQFSTFYQCRPSDESCQATTNWQITKDGAIIKSNTGNNSINEGFTPNGNGTYILTINASCNNKKCEPVTYTIVVSDCSGGGEIGAVTCDCGRWNQIVVNKIKYDPGGSIPGNCNQRFQFSTSYQCSPSDESCQARTTWNIKKDGVIIKTGNGNNQINEAFVPNGNGTYAVTLDAVCNGKRCTQGNFTIVVNDCGEGGEKEDPKRTLLSKPVAYFSMSTEYSAEMVNVKDTLFLQVENNYSSGSNQLTCTIKNLSNNKTSVITIPEASNNQGIIRIGVPLQNSVVAKGEAGILTLRDAKKYYYISFKRN